MKKVTIYFCILLVLGVFVYDVMALIFSGSDATISALVWKLSDESTSFTFAVGLIIGLLLGHLFFPRKIYL